MVQQQQQQQVKQQLGNKVIAGLMPNPTAQAYASIAHAAAAAAQSNQNRQLINNTNNGVNTGYQNNEFNQSDSMHTGSSNNLISTGCPNSLHTKSQITYNNPGFFESASYSNV